MESIVFKGYYFSSGLLNSFLRFWTQHLRVKMAHGPASYDVERMWSSLFMPALELKWLNSMEKIKWRLFLLWAQQYNMTWCWWQSDLSHNTKVGSMCRLVFLCPWTRTHFTHCLWVWSDGGGDKLEDSVSLTLDGCAQKYGKKEWL